MRLYKTLTGVLIEENETLVRVDAAWDVLSTSETLYADCRRLWENGPKEPGRVSILGEEVLAPIGKQEVWASGVTYLRSKCARMEEAQHGGGSLFYDKVYDADRPELFFKAMHYRVSHPMAAVRIREDSTWNVPEPELTLLLSPKQKILGYTIGNDMSSRDIEGANPLYLPQAKTYEGSTALGPCIYLTETPLSPETEIHMQVQRKDKTIYTGATAISQMKRTFDDLVSYLCRELQFPHGCFLMTGTGIIPEDAFSLQKGDLISITVPPIGTLTNRVSD